MNFLSIDDVAAATGLSRSTLAKKRCSGSGIHLFKIGRQIRNDVADVETPNSHQSLFSTTEQITGWQMAFTAMPLTSCEACPRSMPTFARERGVMLFFTALGQTAATASVALMRISEGR